MIGMELYFRKDKVTKPDTTINVVPVNVTCCEFWVMYFQSVERPES